MSMAAGEAVRAFHYNPPKADITILHRDDDLLVVDKPGGLLSVPGKGAEHRDCLETRLKARFHGARIVHRLDMDTSGVMVLAMNAKAHRHLGLQFERRHVAKLYTARVWGQLENDAGTIDLPLICDWPNRPRQMVDHKHGKPALTHWKVLTRENAATRLALEPHTGRSHQLRVHMLALGHPILGDNLYAPKQALTAANTLQLHASRLELFHPTGGERKTFEAVCPF